MATIALYASKVNQMPALIKNVKKSVTDYKSELSKLKKKTLSVDRSVCNMDDIISQVQSSTQTQDQKIQLLDKVSKDSEDFITDTARIDSNVADVINKRKDDFYEKYYYLKPECEKSRWEKIKDKCKKVGEWCKEHWRAIITVVAIIAAVAVAIALPALIPVLLSMGKAALIGGLVGGLIGGGMSALTGGSFLEGFIDGAFTGAVMGALGVLGGALGGTVFAGSCGVLRAMGTVFKVSSGLSAVMGGFDLLSLGIGFFDPNNALVKFNQKLHSSALYNGVQFAAQATAVFSGAALLKMNKMPHTCFIAGTMILTATGLVAIENIKSGDKVIATNPDTFETEEKTVVETYIRKTQNLVHLLISNEEITTTPNHPFYVKGHEFVNAGDLQVGDQVVNVDGGCGIVDAMRLEIVEEPETVYNFQVEDFHTYYVGENGVFVHNAECGGASTGKYSTAIDDKVVEIAKEDLGGLADTFTDRVYRTVETTEDIELYRVYGGKAAKNGGFWTTRRAVTKAETQVNSALKPEWGNTMNWETRVKVPKGTKLNIGTVEKQILEDGTVLAGGADQILLPKDWDPKWIDKGYRRRLK